MYYVKDGTVEMVSTCIKTQSVVDLSFQYYQCYLIPKFHLMDVWYPPLGHALLHVLQ